MKQILFFVGFAISFVLMPGYSDAQVQTPRYIQTITNSNAYYEYVPQGYPEPGKKYPLLIFLHGSGEQGPGNEATLPKVLRNGPPKLINNGTFPTSFTVNGSTYKFIVISPQFVVWPTEEDTDSIINYMISHYPVDIDRVYLTGLSMGGGTVWNYSGISQAHASRLAGIVPVCGAGYPYQDYAVRMAANNLPVWATHNVNDPTVPSYYTVDYVNRMNSAPKPPNPLAKKTIFQKDGHDAWTTTYDPAFKENGLNVYEWMLQYRRFLSVLPVTGLQFSAALAEGNHTTLHWSTIAEYQNQGFRIERSADGVLFSLIATIASTAIDGSGASYVYSDIDPLPGLSYYRLAMLNRDGTVAYSNTKDVRRIGAKGTITLFPNPAGSEIQMDIAPEMSNKVLRIANAAGQQVMKIKLNGSATVTLNIAKLRPGLYYAILGDTEPVSISFVKY